MRCAIVITSIAKKNIQRALSYESFGFEIALRLEQVENQSLHSSAQLQQHHISIVEFKEVNIIAQTSVHFSKLYLLPFIVQTSAHY